jgi:hypothetical protein
MDGNKCRTTGFTGSGDTGGRVARYYQYKIQPLANEIIIALFDVIG